MIEILILVGLAVVGWLVWKGKLKSISKALGKIQVSPPQQATSSAPNTNSQTNAPSPNTPIEQQPVAPVEVPTPAPEPVVEPEPQAPVVDAVAEKPTTTPFTAEEATAVKIPEDSILKRHYLAALQAEKDALSNPYPTDSVLRRHYETLHKIATPQHSKTVDESKSDQPQTSSPEDSTVRKHSLEQLRTEVAGELPAPPTDSVLKRHYESLLQTKLQQRLAGQ
ncbi:MULTISPECIES: hypothetical protein [Methylomonas]|uniref:Uncharacterized protein n=2 Tax=Methylomonas TaxID=416 RepID=A0A126T7B2_9GAMM|nr:MULTISPECIES: hypothetical protein [Methylomonas]AMK77920.1 hypothetical protein JT25_015785 [Methylomonas denitrificans]OAI08849.1 hypothetical protein A1342_09555 [Methylomonas methanica]TCV85453.1 hypothetical protein EDE11_10512 [Methylomonas methanica]